MSAVHSFIETSQPARTAQQMEVGIDVEAMEVACRGFSADIGPWRVERGTRVALIGPNGNGKTTIMETLLGLREAVSLSGSMHGADFREWRTRPELRRKLGVLLQNAGLPAELQVGNVIALHTQLYGKTSKRVTDALAIEVLRRKKYKSLSRGERQRVDLMLALAHEPELVFLDEPLTGLDKQFAEAACDLISGMCGTTLVMACHSAEELEVCDKVAWIQAGRMRMWDDKVAMRRKMLGDARLRVSFVSEEDCLRFQHRVMAELAPKFTKSESSLQFCAFGDDSLGKLARGLVDDGQVEGFEFGRTSYTDLLYRCALGENHV